MIFWSKIFVLFGCEESDLLNDEDPAVVAAGSALLAFDPVSLLSELEATKELDELAGAEEPAGAGFEDEIDDVAAIEEFGGAADSADNDEFEDVAADVLDEVTLAEESGSARVGVADEKFEADELVKAAAIKEFAGAANEELRTVEAFKGAGVDADTDELDDSDELFAADPVEDPDELLRDADEIVAIPEDVDDDELEGPDDVFEAEDLLELSLEDGFLSNAARTASGSVSVFALL